MTYKLVGCIFLLLAGLWGAVSMRRFEYRRLRVLDGYLALLAYVKGQISCFATPLPDILAGADPRILAACLGLDAGRRETPPPLSLPTEEPILPHLLRESHPYLEEETERLLSAFTGEVGKTFRAEQIARCDYYLEALTEERRRLFRSLPARLRLGTALPLCLSLGAMVILW